jgi:hypothetical protein
LYAVRTVAYVDAASAHYRTGCTIRLAFERISGITDGQCPLRLSSLQQPLYCSISNRALQVQERMCATDRLGGRSPSRSTRVRTGSHHAGDSTAINLVRGEYWISASARRHRGNFRGAHACRYSQNVIFREPENRRGVEYCPCTMVLSFDSR